MSHDQVRRLYVWGEIAVSVVWVALCYVAELHEWLPGQTQFMDTVYVVQFVLFSTLVLLHGWNDSEQVQRREHDARTDSITVLGKQNNATLQHLKEEINEVKAILSGRNP